MKGKILAMLLTAALVGMLAAGGSSGQNVQKALGRSIHRQMDNG